MFPLDVNNPNGKVMVIVMMEITMQSVFMMVEIVVETMLKHITVNNVNV